LIGYYNASVVATYYGLATAVIGIAFAMGGHIQIALFCLMVCGLCDMIDGPIARKCRRNEDEKSFGIQIDSLCDLICFGALPATICLATDQMTWYTALAAAFYVLAGVIRLGYFNVQEINRVRTDPGRRKTYDGLPITSSALLMPAFAAADAVVHASFGGFYAAPMLVVGLLFISPFRIPKLHMRGMILGGGVGAAIFAIIAAFGSRLNLT
jgi:CDP-diacylglycerol--serine O-phosphatidyltransferase